MSNFVVWSTEVVPRCFVLDELEGVDLDVELRTGIPCRDSFPPNAVYTVDPAGGRVLQYKAPGTCIRETEGLCRCEEPPRGRISAGYSAES